MKYAERYRRDGPAGAVVAPHRKAIQRLADCCQSRSELLGRQSRHTEPLIALAAHSQDWLRPPEDWEPPNASTADQFRSLARHLFARYDVPPFLEAAWLKGLGDEGLIYQGWYKQAGRGESLRSLSGLPIRLTKRMAHHLAQAPEDLDIPSALRWAQVRGMGADERLARTILVSRIGTDFARDTFWLEVIRWFLNHPDLAPRHHGPMIDYLHNQKYVPSVANPHSRRRGEARQARIVPRQPDLAMKGRTPASLLRDVDAWHRQLGAEQPAMSVEWKPSGIRPFTYQAGAGPARRIFALTEMISSDELQEEGRAMGHCVATYWKHCFAGLCSLWSLTAEDPFGEVTRLLTVEVRPALHTIVQARGSQNRLPTNEETAILDLWSESGGPQLSSYLQPEDREG